MKVTVAPNPELDACTLEHDSVHLETEADVVEWRRQIIAELEKHVGSGRAYFLIDYRGFSINPLLADSYGRVAEEIRKRFAKDAFRYGAQDPLSVASARLQSMKRSHASNVFPNRKEAVAALERARARVK